MTRAKLAFEVIMRLEGFHSLDTQDPGGDTYWGIARRYHPHEAPWPPSRERAAEIFEQGYWRTCWCDEIPEPLDVVMADCAFNQGPGVARRVLAELAGVPHEDAIREAYAQDMVIKSIHHQEAVGAASGLGDIQWLVEGYMWRRVVAYHDSPNWARYVHGWMNRLVRLHNMINGDPNAELPPGVLTA